MIEKVLPEFFHPIRMAKPEELQHTGLWGGRIVAPRNFHLAPMRPSAGGSGSAWESLDDSVRVLAWAFIVLLPTPAYESSFVHPLTASKFVRTFE